MAVSAGTDQIMLVYAILTHGGSVSALTYNGTALTSVGSVSAGNSTTMYVYRLVNPAVTTANLVLTNGGAGYAHIVVSLYTGVNQTTPIGNTATGTNGGSDPFNVSVSHTRSSSDSTVLVASALGHNTSPAGNSTSAGTGRHYANSGGEIRSYALSDHSPGSIGTTNYTHTRTSSGWSTGGAYALELMPAGAADSPTPTPTHTPYYSPTHTPVIAATPTPTPGSGCTIAYDGNGASFGSTQVGSGTWTNAWNRGSASNAVMFVVLTVSSGWSGTVTYNGVAMTLLSSVTNSNNTLVYYLVNPASGSNNIAVDAVPDDWDSAALTAFSYSGINTSDPFLSNNFASGTGSSGSPYTQDVNLTPLRGDSTVLGIHTVYDNTASTAHTISGGTNRYFDSRSLYNNRNIGVGDIPSTGSAMVVSQAFTGGSGTKSKIAFAIELNPCGPQPTATATPSQTPYQSPTHTPFLSQTPTFTFTPTITRTWTLSYTASPTATRTQTPNWTHTVSPTPAPASPTHTLTPIAIPMSKTINVASATIGDTITYCISWQNNTGGSTTVVIWDTLPMAMTYLGANNSGTYAPRLVTWNLGSQANGASGSVCFWAVIAGYPWLPGADVVANLDYRYRNREDGLHWLPTLYMLGGRP